MAVPHHLELNMVFKHVCTHGSHSTLTTILEADAFVIHIFTDKTNAENWIISQDRAGNKWPSKNFKMDTLIPKLFNIVYLLYRRLYTHSFPCFSFGRSVKCRPGYLTHTHTHTRLCLPPSTAITFSSPTSWPIILEDNFSSPIFSLSHFSMHLGVKKQISSQATVLEIVLMSHNSKGKKTCTLCHQPLKILKVSYHPFQILCNTFHLSF